MKIFSINNVVVYQELISSKITFFVDIMEDNCIKNITSFHSKDRAIAEALRINSIIN